MNAPKNLPEKILELSRGFQLSQCLFTATALGIPDLLKDGAKTCDELALATQTHSPSLYRVLRVLVTIELVTEIAPYRFEATALAGCLQTDAPNSLKDFVLLRAEQYYPCWQDLTYSIQTGNSAFEKTFGTSHYLYNQQTPELSERFDKIMSVLAQRQKQAILAAYDFSGLDNLVDIGGGQGSLLISILERYPSINAVLFDQAETIVRAHQLLAEHQLSERCQAVAGSFFEALPQGKDVYILKHVLHNWDDEQVLQILQNCRAAMATGKKLLVIEGVITGQASQRAVLLDLMMLVSFASGKLRTEAEFQELLQASGFMIERIIPSQLDISIIEAVAI